MKHFKNIVLILLYILGLVLLTFLPACNKEGFLEPKRNIEISIEHKHKIYIPYLEVLE
jgi:hypothetical protein